MNLIPALNILYTELKIKCLSSSLFILMISSYCNSYALFGIVFALIHEHLRTPRPFLFISIKCENKSLDYSILSRLNTKYFCTCIQKFSSSEQKGRSEQLLCKSLLLQWSLCVQLFTKE